MTNKEIYRNYNASLYDISLILLDHAQSDKLIKRKL